MTHTNQAITVKISQNICETNKGMRTSRNQPNPYLRNLSIIHEIDLILMFCCLVSFPTTHNLKKTQIINGTLMQILLKPIYQSPSNRSMNLIPYTKKEKFIIKNTVYGCF